MRKRGVQIERNSAKALFEVGREVQQRLRNPVPKPTGSIDYPVGAMFITVGTITAMTGAMPGYGNAKIQDYAGPGTSYTDASTTVYVIINDTTSTIASGSYLYCTPGPGGWYHYTQINSCANLS